MGLRAYYGGSITEFLNHSLEHVLGAITANIRHELEEKQKNAWIQQIQLLKHQLNGIPDGYLFFEFVIPRMGKRADCVLLYKGWVIVIEFKVGSSAFERSAIDQVVDYCLDLKNFHQASHTAHILPVLIATHAHGSHQRQELHPDADWVYKPILLNGQSLGDFLKNLQSIDHGQGIDPNQWLHGVYMPTPTIIEAAQALYANHSVEEITRSDAGAKNLNQTRKAIEAIINKARAEKFKAICFVTGVPGAGKTLAGLNIACQQQQQHLQEMLHESAGSSTLNIHHGIHESDETRFAVFLSGNGPLVDVLRESLVRDVVRRQKVTRSKIERQVKSFIQNVHVFRDEYAKDKAPPYENVVVFDEAQRAWSREQASRFMREKRNVLDFNQSEPEFLIEVMDRHQEWCVIVCLIGGGQEINRGESGIAEWLDALRNKFSHWHVYASSKLDQGHYVIDLPSVAFLNSPRVQRVDGLHLAVSMRSFRAELLSEFIGYVLEGDTQSARRTCERITRYPLMITRNAHTAREWLRGICRGTERVGFVASSGAIRLKPEGIYVKSELSPANWFLNEAEDVRSSCALEDVATEFDIQGLELDWVGVGWDADLRFEKGQWSSYRFRGSRWEKLGSEDNIRYLRNAYRVLLTRARQGLMVLVPPGDPRDPTRPPAFYDQTYQFLLDCGFKTLDH